MKILIAGSNTRNVQDYCRWYGVPKLYSFLNERGLIEAWDDEHFLMVDSGAHTWNKETITKIGMSKKTAVKPASGFIRTYFDFIEQHRHMKVIWVEFDVYGHLPIKWIDLLFKRVIDLGIAGKYLRVYHPMLDGGSLDMLRKWIDEGNDYVGIGNDSTEMLDKIFYLTRDKIKIHGFAMTKMDLIEHYPFYSVDSTSPLSTVIFGKYSIPILNSVKRQDIYKLKSIECFDDDWQRLEKAVIEVAVVQDYVTELWKLKGVTWNDLAW